ncbi:MAG: hypothetical protein QW512_04605 [Thermofilaceae archaeon]
MKGVKLLVVLVAFHVLTSLIVFSTGAVELRPPSIVISFELVKYSEGSDFWSAARNFFAAIINVLYGVGTILYSLVRLLVWVIQVASYSMTFSYVPHEQTRLILTTVSTLLFVYALITAVMEARGGTP